MLNLDRMLEKCVTEQWKVTDLDWTVKPRPMSREDEIAVVQYFTDMAGIERLAKALFEEQRRRATDPVLKKIFSTFVVDEERHAVAAERLAAHYDVHQYRRYEMTPALAKFAPHFVAAIRGFSAEVANVYITMGELLLDVALLRSLNDYVDDEMSNQAMHLINRDESRHIAIDYHMTEYYASAEYQRWLAEQPRRSTRELAAAWWSFVNMLRYIAPFVKGVFLEPMAMTDPSGRRLREAVKRAQLLARKPDVARRPVTRFFNGLRWVVKQPLVGSVLGPVAGRLAGMPPDIMVDMYTDEELRRAERTSFEQLAEEALAAKYAS